MGDVVGAPDVWKPVGGRDGEVLVAYLRKAQAQLCGGFLVVFEAHRDARDALVNIACGAEGLLRGAGFAVDRGVDAPDGGALVKALVAHKVLVLSPVTAVFHPQATVHRLEDGLGFPAVWLRVLANELGNAGGEQVCAVIVR